MDRHLKAHLYDISTAINPEIEISNARAIIATRNRVIHDYAAVTDDVMWKIVINDLPKLKIEVDTLLAEPDK